MFRVLGLSRAQVLEPTFIGNATSLHPVAVLLAILLYGSVWGITGMVMAIPLTAVLRIYLASIEHPLTVYVMSVSIKPRHSHQPRSRPACSHRLSFESRVPQRGIARFLAGESSGYVEPPPRFENGPSTLV